MIGGASILAELIVTFPRDVGATKEDLNGQKQASEARRWKSSQCGRSLRCLLHMTFFAYMPFSRFTTQIINWFLGSLSFLVYFIPLLLADGALRYTRSHQVWICK